MTMLAKNGHWVDNAERTPPKYGQYRVIRRTYGGKTEEDEYLWNGSSWVTHKNSLSNAVSSWWEEAAADSGTLTTSGGAAPASLAMYEARIQLYKEQAITGYIGIGRTLNEAKAAGVVPHGEWEAWVERTTGLAIRQAQRCMKAASEIRDGSFLGQIDMSKAMLLLSSGLENEQQEALAEQAVKEDSSVRELREQIRKLKLEKVAEAGANAEIRTALKAAESERDQLKGQMAAAVQAVRDDAERKATEAYERGTKDQSRMNTAALRAANNAIDRYEKQNRELQQQLKDAESANQDQYNLGKDAGDQERRKLRGQVDDLLEERNRLQAALRDARESSGAEDMAKQIQTLKAEAEKQAEEAYARGKEEMQVGTVSVLSLRMKELEQELAAAEAREAKKARELAELKKERAKAGMDAARGIRADAINGLDLAAAVRSFIGAAGTLPQMGAAIAGMSENERDGIRAQVETVAEWVRASRAALGIVAADATIQ